MPQFDVVSFIPQLLWLGVTFLGFYFIFTFYFLPRWGSVLKARQKSFYISKKNQKENIKLNGNSFKLVPNPLSSIFPKTFINIHIK